MATCIYEIVIFTELILFELWVYYFLFIKIIDLLIVYFDKPLWTNSTSALANPRGHIFMWSMFWDTWPHVQFVFPFPFQKWLHFYLWMKQEKRRLSDKD